MDERRLIKFTELECDRFHRPAIYFHYHNILYCPAHPPEYQSILCFITRKIKTTVLSKKKTLQNKNYFTRFTLYNMQFLNLNKILTIKYVFY